tara:strand:- start:138 stop:437 length:300 start_codon:yes stop_codon:yes gene_type:complete
LIKKGNGFLLQSHHKGELFSNGLFAQNKKTCRLISVQKISSSIDKPVLHALIREAMLQSREMNCSQSDFMNSAIGLQVSDLRWWLIFQLPAFAENLMPD